MPEIKLFERTPVIVAVIAAAASLGVALAGAIGASVSAYYQRQSEIDKMRMTMIIQIAGRTSDAKSYAMDLIETGILPDPKGSVCRAFIKSNCPIQVLDSNPGPTK